MTGSHWHDTRKGDPMSVLTATDVKPKFQAKFSGIHLATRNVAESVQFLVEIIGGKRIAEDTAGARVRFTDFDVVVHRVEGSVTPHGREYPHYAFGVDAQLFVGIMRRLDAYQVPHNHPWTRKGNTHSLMYFRDPSGNQFELFAPHGTAELIPLRIGSRAGGDYVIDFDALTYDGFTRPADDRAAPLSPPKGFNHLTMPVRDLALGKRFLVEVLDGEVTLDLPTHVTATVGGVDIGIAPQPEGYTGPTHRYWHMEFAIDGPTLLRMHERLKAAGVPASPIAANAEREALLYFRDPSGNLWKLLCRDAGAEVLAAAIPDASVDVSALNYTWRPRAT
jgi:catechol 2,3-dioxygenase-like lactoylglutathione lyase family enzyme